jgi:hypothetical protein
MLKYPNWQHKKNKWRHLYLLCLGEEMVRPHIRWKVEMWTDIFARPQELPLKIWRKTEEDGVEGVLLVQKAKDSRTD